MLADVGYGSACLTFYVCAPASTKQPSRNHSVPLEGKGHRTEGSFSKLYHFMHHGVWLLCCWLPFSLTASLLNGGRSSASHCHPGWQLRRKEGAVSLVRHYRKENPYISE